MILGLTLFSISFIFLCSILLLAFGLGPTHDEPLTLPQSIWISLTHMLDPGTVSGNEGNWPFDIHDDSNPLWIDHHNHPDRFNFQWNYG